MRSARQLLRFRASSIVLIFIFGAILLQCTENEAKKRRPVRSAATLDVDRFAQWDDADDDDTFDPNPNPHTRIIRATDKQKQDRYEHDEDEEEEEEEVAAAEDDAEEEAAEKAKKEAARLKAAAIPPLPITIVKLNSTTTTTTTTPKPSNSTAPSGSTPKPSNSTSTAPTKNGTAPASAPKPAMPTMMPMSKPTTPGPVVPKARQGEIYLPEGYNNLEIPKLNIGKAYGLNILTPLPCLVYMNIRSIRGIDELEEQVTIEVDLVVEWIDGVLFDITQVKYGKAPTQKVLNPVFLKKIWTPDIYMDNLIRVTKPSLMAKPQTLKFSPETGFISYTSRLAMSVDCDMDFHYYPADTQKCEFTLKSYSHFSSDLDLSWLKHGVYLEDPAEPNFDIQVTSTEALKKTQGFNNPRNETHDALRFTLYARRKLSFHMVQTYLPSVFFIVITWLCFLIPSRMVEARIGISMTTLLTLTSMFASVRESSPIVSYVKAIDIWMVACIFFVFLTLLEFAVLLWMRAVREEHEEKKIDQENKQVSIRNKGRGKSDDAQFVRSNHVVKLTAYEIVGEATEKYAFVIFSIIFIVFNVVYWTWLIQSAEYLDWNVNATHNALLEDD